MNRCATYLVLSTVFVLCGVSDVGAVAEYDGMTNSHTAGGGIDAANQSVVVGDGVADALVTNGSARVTIGLTTPVPPETHMNSWEEIVERRSTLRNTQHEIERALAATGSTITTRFTSTPTLAAVITTDGFEVVRELPEVARIQLDRLYTPMLDETTIHTQAADVWASGYTGQGIAVAVVDTGVDTSHPMFSDKVITQACFSTTDDAEGAESLCPNGLDQQYGSNAAQHCDNGIDGCSHGTHVAGIAVGNEWQNLSGIAPDADLIAIQVFTKFTSVAVCGSEDPCIRAYDSDIRSALEYIAGINGPGTDVAAVNLSLGGGKYVTSCDDDPDEVDMRNQIEQLLAEGVVTVAASGNDGYSNAVSTPACISSTISVGSTYTQNSNDYVSAFTNTASDLVDLYAPGSGVRSAVPGAGAATFSGTSMAAPHVAGAWALIREARPNATTAEILAALQTTGNHVAQRNANSPLCFSHPRININDAISELGTPTATHTLNVRCNGSGTGTITATSGPLVCPGNCAARYPQISEVTITAAPAEGSYLVGWGGACSGSQLTCTLTTSNKVTTVDAEFAFIPPDNDDLSDAHPLNVDSPVSQVTAGATDQDGEPQPTCEPGAPMGGVWFTWTADYSSELSVSTVGSDFDTVLTVYRADALSDGVGALGDELACDSGTEAGGYTDAAVTFTGSPGGTFAIRVSGYLGASGNVVLTSELTLIEFDVSVVVDGVGVVSVVGGGECSGECVVSGVGGSVVSFVARAGEGHVFVGWGGVCSGVGVCDVTVADGLVVSALFEPAPPEFDVSVILCVAVREGVGV